MPYAIRRKVVNPLIASSLQKRTRMAVMVASEQGPFYTKRETYSQNYIYVPSIKYSSNKANGDRRSATPYAAVTVYTGWIASGWTTYTGTGFVDHDKYENVIRSGPAQRGGVFGTSPHDSSRLLTVPSRDVTWARSLAASNALSAEFSLLTTLAEMRSTVEGITAIVSKLAHSAASLKKGRFRAALRHLGYSPKDISILRNKARADLSDRAKALADAGGEWHLAYRYGIAPVIYDFDALRSMWENGVKTTHKFVVKGITQRSEIKREGSGENEVEIVDSYTVRFKACYAVHTHLLAKLTLLGATDLLGTLWELTPWSFVVDWGLNVGDFLRGLQAPIGMTYLNGHVSVKGTTTIAYIRPASNAYTTWHRPAQRCEGYIRERLGAPAVSLMFQNPFENSTNITTALALINQKMR